jgi:hypothetical protein
MKCRVFLSFLFALGFVVIGSSARGAEGSTSAKAAAAPAEVVDLFAAAEKGDIEVRLIPKDSTTGTVTIKNNTDRPLTIKLPEAFAGVPVLAQGLGVGGGLGMGGGGGNNNNNQNQGFGGGMGGMGMGGMGMGGMGGGGFGGGGGLFNVGPEKVGKIKFAAVCLEHGKLDPNPRVPYTMKPIESFTSKGEVIEVVKMLSRGEIDQRSAQAAAWHLTDDMSWNELAGKIGKKHLDGRVEPYFTPSQLEMAVRITREAAHRSSELAKRSPAASPVKSLIDK